MGETIPFFENEIKDAMQGIIKVVGVGGGGCNAVRNMYNEGVQGVTYAVCNTDSQSLSRSPVPVKILLGRSGLGAGGNPEMGRSEAETNINDFTKLLSDGTQMVFVTAGINEKCSRIKKVFLDMMDEYTASYYIISSHTQKHIVGSSRVWYERLKIITLPRELVVKEE